MNIHYNSDDSATPSVCTVALQYLLSSCFVIVIAITTIIVVVATIVVVAIIIGVAIIIVVGIIIVVTIIIGVAIIVVVTIVPIDPPFVFPRVGNNSLAVLT